MTLLVLTVPVYQVQGTIVKTSMVCLSTTACDADERNPKSFSKESFIRCMRHYSHQFRVVSHKIIIAQRKKQTRTQFPLNGMQRIYIIALFTSVVPTLKFVFGLLKQSSFYRILYSKLVSPTESCMYDVQAKTKTK